MELLAKRLGVTKGSFYHHFADRDELLRAVLDRWHGRATSHMIEPVHQHSRRPEEQLRRLVYLNTSTRALDREQIEGEGTLTYASTRYEEAIFDLRFQEHTEITGHVKLELRVSTAAGHDMDRFVGHTAEELMR